MDDDGYLYLADRLADVIDTSDGPVYPAQVETAIGGHPAVRSCVAVGVPDGDGHERVHAIIDVGDHDVDEAELVTWAAKHLPGHAAPKTVELVHEPLRDAAGKVRRAALRDAHR